MALESLAFQNVGASIHACEAIAELVTDASALRCGPAHGHHIIDDF